MYSNYAQQKGWGCKRLEAAEGDSIGLKSGNLSFVKEAESRTKLGFQGFSAFGFSACATGPIC